MNYNFLENDNSDINKFINTYCLKFDMHIFRWIFYLVAVFLISH